MRNQLIHPVLKADVESRRSRIQDRLADSITQFAAGGRADLVDKETAELKVLEGYLPQRLSADEVAAEVARIVKELGASGPGDMGKVMGAVKAQLAGKADMSLVSAAVKQVLAK